MAGGATLAALAGTAGTVEPRTTAGAYTLTLAPTAVNASTNTFGGVLANNGSAILGLTFSPSSTQTQVLTGNNTFTGATTINGGTLQIGAGGAIGSIASTSGVTISGGNLAFNLNATVSFAPTGGISGTASTLTQAGPGILTLPGPNTFGGNVAVTGGTLQLQSGSVGSAAAVSVSTSAALNVFNVSTSASPLTLASLTVSSGAALGFGLNGSNPTLTNVPISTTSLTAAGVTTINLTNTGTQTTGDFPLVQYTSYTGPSISTAFTLGAVTSRTVASLDFTTAGLIKLNVTSVDSIIWTGVNSTNWDAGTQVNVGGTLNWKTKSLSATTNFIPGDSVIFDDSSLTSAVTPGVVTLTQTVNPSSVTFNNSTALAYTLSGTGFAIADNGASPATLSVQGAGTVTLNLANTYSGGTTVSSGQLNINSATAIGTGPLTISGGTISNTFGFGITLSTNNAQNWNGSFTFGGNNALNMGTGAVTLGTNVSLTLGVGPNTAPLTIGGSISGAYSLTLGGTGTLNLNGASPAFTGSATLGGVTLNSGLLNIGNATAPVRARSP